MKTKFLSLLAITALLFVSCSEDDNIPEANDGMVKFSSGVSGLQTRVGGVVGDDWEENDPIGIYMRNNAGKTILEQNVQYTAKSVGKSTSFTSTSPLYYPVNSPEKVDFVAYHPYQSGISGYTYNVNVADQTSQSAIDLMLATADNSGAGYDKTYTSAVNLNFRHQLVKVVLGVSKGSGIADLDGLTVSIKGMKTKANFNIETPGLSNEESVLAITPYNYSNSTTYEAILLPVSVLDANHVLEFTIGGNTYEWTMSENDRNIDKLEAGKKYTFIISVQKNAVSVTGTIDPWETVDRSNGTAN